jgi:sulfur relay (sulfurtransferase) DsrF/TusC family protein
MIKSIVIITDQSPIGKNSVRESLRLASGFLGLGEEIECKVVLTGDAVLFLNKNADTSAVGIDSFDESLEMADLSDLHLYVTRESMKEAGITEEHLIAYANLEVISEDEVARLIEAASTSFRF